MDLSLEGEGWAVPWGCHQAAGLCVVVAGGNRAPQKSVREPLIEGILQCPLLRATWLTEVPPKPHSQQVPLPHPPLINQTVGVLTGLKTRPWLWPHAIHEHMLPDTSAALPQLWKPTRSLFLIFVKDLLRQ